MTRCQFFFFGTVQGVGFRYTANSIAKHFNVTGFVRNRSNSSVELLVEGTKDEINHFLISLRNRMEGFIEREELTESPVTGEFDGFEIR